MSAPAASAISAADARCTRAEQSTCNPFCAHCGANAGAAAAQLVASSSCTEQAAADPTSSILIPFTLGLKRRAQNTLDLEGAGFVVRQPNEAANSAATESLEHDDETVAMLCATLEKALAERIAPGIITAISALLPCVADRASVILESGIVARLASFCLSRAQAASSVQLLDSAAKLFTLLCKASPTPEFGPLSRALPALADMLYSSSHEQLCNAALAVATLADERTAEERGAAGSADKKIEDASASTSSVASASGAASDGAAVSPGLCAHPQIQSVVQSGVVRRLVELLSHKSSTVKAFALRAVGSICSGDDVQTQVAILAGALPGLLALLSHPMKLIRLDAVWSLGNICAGNAAQIQAVMDTQIPVVLLAMLRGNAESVEVRREITLALGAALAGASQVQVRDLARLGIVASICESLATPDVTLQMLSLQCLELLLAAGAAGVKLAAEPIDVNGVADAIEECGGLDRIESLQFSTCEPVWAKATALLHKHFESESEDPYETTTSVPVIPMPTTAPAPTAAGATVTPTVVAAGAGLPLDAPSSATTQPQPPRDTLRPAAGRIQSTCRRRMLPCDAKLRRVIRVLLDGADLTQLTTKIVRSRACDMLGLPLSTHMDYAEFKEQTKRILNEELERIKTLPAASNGAKTDDEDALPPQQQQPWRVEWLRSASASEQLAAAIGIRQALCSDDPPIPLFIDELPTIVRLIQDPRTTPQMLHELCWIVLNMASVDGSADTPGFIAEKIHDSGAAAALVALLASPQTNEVAETVAWTLGNLARDWIGARGALLREGAVQALAQVIVTGSVRPAMRLNTSWALRALLCGAHKRAVDAEFDAAALAALPALSSLLRAPEREVRLHVCEIFAAITAPDTVVRPIAQQAPVVAAFTAADQPELQDPSLTKTERPRCLLDAILEGKIVWMLCGALRCAPAIASASAPASACSNDTAQHNAMRLAALQAVGNVAASSTTQQQTQRLLDQGIMRALAAALDEESPCGASTEPLRVLALWCLSNLLRGASVAQIGLVLSPDIEWLAALSVVRESPRCSKAEAHNLGYVYSNLLRDCSASQRRTAMDAGVLRELLALLPHSSPKLLRALLEAFEGCLTFLRDSWIENDAEFGASAFIEENTESLSALLALSARSHSEATIALIASMLEELFNVQLPKKKAAAKPAVATTAAATVNEAAAATKPISTAKPVQASKPIETATAPAAVAAPSTAPTATVAPAAAATPDTAAVTRHKCSLCAKVFAAAHFLEKHKSTKHAAAVAAPVAATSAAPVAPAAEKKAESTPSALPDLSALSLAPAPQQSAVSQFKVLEDAAAAAVLADRMNAALASIAQLRASTDAVEQAALCASLCDALQRASPQHLDAMVDRGIIAAFAHVLAQEEQGNEDSQEHAVAALGHLAASAPARRDAVLAAGVLPSLLRLCVPIARISLLRRCVCTLASLCRRNVDWASLSSVVPVLAQLLKMRGDEELMLHLCSAFAAISEPAESKDGQDPASASANARLTAIVSSGAARSLVDLLLHRSLQLQSSAFVVVAQLALGDESVLQVLLTETGLLASLRTTLAHSSPAIRAAAARVLKNATRACNVAQIQLLISAALVPLLVARRRTDEVEVRCEAAAALCSLATRGDPNQIRYLVTQGVMQQLCFLLDSSADADVSLVFSALSGLESMLRVGALTSFEEPLLSNRFSKQLEQGEGRQAMRALSGHRDQKVAEKARAILAVHFPTENPAAAATAAASSAAASSSASAAAAPAAAATPATKSRVDEIAALRPLLLSDSAASQLRALQGLRALLVSSPSSVLAPLVDSSGLLARAVFLLLSNSDVQGVPAAAAALLGSVASLGSDSQKQLLLELSALPCIFMMLHKASGEAQRSGLAALRAMLGGSASIVQSMLMDARLVQVLVGVLLSLHPLSDGASFTVCADALCVTVISSSDAQLRLMLQKQPAVLSGISKMLWATRESAAPLAATTVAATQRVLSVVDHEALTAAAAAASSSASSSSSSSASAAAAATPAIGLAQLRSALLALLPTQPQVQPLLAFFE